MVEPQRRKQAENAPLNGVRILIVESGYYADIADTLLTGAKRALDVAGAAYDVVTVPGALEIPQAIVIALDAVRGAKAYHGVVALGCVIRGETSHYDIVAGVSARALMEIGTARTFACAAVSTVRMPLPTGTPRSTPMSMSARADSPATMS